MTIVHDLGGNGGAGPPRRGGRKEGKQPCDTLITTDVDGLRGVGGWLSMHPSPPCPPGLMFAIYRRTGAGAARGHSANHRRGGTRGFSRGSSPTFIASTALDRRMRRYRSNDSPVSSLEFDGRCGLRRCPSTSPNHLRPICFTCSRWRLSLKSALPSTYRGGPAAELGWR